MSAGKSHYRAFAKAAFLVGFPVIISRVLGLVREQYALYLFGASWELDAYISAYKIPTILRNLLGEGAFSVVFIAIFSSLWSRNRFAAQKFVNQTLSYLILISAIISIIAFFTTPYYMSLIHRSTENLPLAVHLSKIMVLFINFISVAGILMGILNSQGRYIVPAMAPAVANVANILLIRFGHAYFGIDVLALGYLLNAFVIMIIQIPFVCRMEVGFRFDFSYTPRLAYFLKSFFPVAFGMAFFQINQLLSNSFSSQIEGGNSIMDKSFLVIQMAIATLSAGISTALLPTIAKEKSLGSQHKIFRDSMKITFLVVFPSTVLFIGLGPNISSFIYKDMILLVSGSLGKIDIHTVNSIGTMLIFFGPAILIYALLTMVTRVFQGINLFIYPLIGSAISTVFNILIMGSLFSHLGIVILPISLIISSFIDLILLLFLVKYKFGKSVFNVGDGEFFIKNLMAAMMISVYIFVFNPLLAHYCTNLIRLPFLLSSGFILYFIFLCVLKEKITTSFAQIFLLKKK